MSISMSLTTALDERVARSRVLVLSRSFPNAVLPRLGLWVERLVLLLAERCEMRVVSPVPWCPPLPDIGPMRQYLRFRRIPPESVRSGVRVSYPRFLVGPGTTLYAIESQAYYRGVVGTVDRIRNEFPFDLVHAHFIYPDGVVAHRLARRYGVPFVITEHAPWIPSWIGRRGVMREALSAAAAAQALTAVSTSVRDSMAEFGVDRTRVEVIPNGVDDRLFELGAVSERKPHQLLYVGVINFNKGIDVLLRAMEMLLRRDVPVRLVAVGGAFYRDTRLQQERLHGLAHELGLNGHVSFLGEQSPRDVARLMRESALLVLPSRAESFGSVLVEALACGTPVVSTRSGGPEDIVDPAVGTLVPPDDPAALADALAETLANLDRYSPVDLRDYAIRRFGWDPVVQRTLGVYQEVLGGD